MITVFKVSYNGLICEDDYHANILSVPLVNATPPPSSNVVGGLFDSFQCLVLRMYWLSFIFGILLRAILLIYLKCCFIFVLIHP